MLCPCQYKKGITSYSLNQEVVTTSLQLGFSGLDSLYMQVLNLVPHTQKASINTLLYNGFTGGAEGIMYS